MKEPTVQKLCFMKWARISQNYQTFAWKRSDWCLTMKHQQAIWNVLHLKLRFDHEDFHSNTGEKSFLESWQIMFFRLELFPSVTAERAFWSDHPGWSSSAFIKDAPSTAKWLLIFPSKLPLVFVGRSFSRVIKVFPSMVDGKADTVDSIDAGAFIIVLQLELGKLTPKVSNFRIVDCFLQK